MNGNHWWVIFLVAFFYLFMVINLWFGMWRRHGRVRRVQAVPFARSARTTRGKRG